LGGAASSFCSMRLAANGRYVPVATLTEHSVRAIYASPRWVTPARTCGRSKHVEPSRREDGDAKRHIAGVDHMYTQLARLCIARAGHAAAIPLEHVASHVRCTTIDGVSTGARLDSPMPTDKFATCVTLPSATSR
jgi:hypothetical protein